MTMAPDFEFVEGPTSDLSFVARGDTPEEALAAAAEALLAATVEDPASVRDELSRCVELAAGDLDLLLLRFLNELVYLRDAEDLLLRARHVRVADLPEGPHIHAELVGERWCSGRHIPGAEVKAATVHGLALRPVNGRWEARATLDV